MEMESRTHVFDWLVSGCIEREGLLGGKKTVKEF
jgi:hypothetical protein